MRPRVPYVRLSLITLTALGLAVPVTTFGSDPSANGEFLASPTSTGGPAQGMLWVEDNNLGRAGGTTPDFKDMFTERADEWRRAREQIGVYLLRANTLIDPANELTDAFLRDDFLPKLDQWDMALALDVTGATWAQCRTRASVMLREVEQIDRIVRLGGEVRYLSMQSALSKQVSGCPEYGNERGYDLRIADIVRYVKFMKGRYRGIQVGLIDALVAKDRQYGPVYLALVEKLQSEGLALDYIHLDFPMEQATPGWANARAAEDFVRHRLGLRFGITYTSSEGGLTSNRAFLARVLRAFRAYREAGGRPDDLPLLSWFPHPSVSLPEDSPTDAPLMKVVLDLGRLGGVTAKSARRAPPARRRDAPRRAARVPPTGLARTRAGRVFGDEPTATRRLPRSAPRQPDRSASATPLVAAGAGGERYHRG